MEPYMQQHNNQQHPILTEMLVALDEEQLEAYEERAAILEFDAGLDRPLAEAVALLDIIKRYGWPPASK